MKLHNWDCLTDKPWDYLLRKMKIFKNRQAAGRLLANHLKKYKGQPNTLVLGIPRGGVVVGYEVAKKLKLPLDILITRKIGHPNQPELAIGAVDADGQIVWDVEVKEVEGLIEEEVWEIKRREQVYRQDRKPIDLSGKTAILVDDGIATGSTISAAINYLKKHQAKKIILAVPVVSREAEDRLSNLVDEAIILETPDYFQAVGQFYDQFEPVEDSEVVELLNYGR